MLDGFDMWLEVVTKGIVMSADQSAPILAFTGPQIVRLTGLSQRQLRYWEESGVFRATYIDDKPYRPYRRIYSFRDLVSLRALALFRNSYRVSLSELRAVGAYLTTYVNAPWAEMQFKISPNRHVIFRHPASGQWTISEPLGQLVLPTIYLDEIRKSAEVDSSQLRERDRADIGRITRHRHIAHNKWIVAGTRVTTSAIWSFHEDGFSIAEIQAQYPHITEADIRAAIQHEQELRIAA